MIISLNLPDEIVAFIDRKATQDKRSRSAWMTGALRNMQLMDSPRGKQAFTQCLRGIVADEALRLGLPMDQVRKAFPDFDRPAAAPQLLAPPLATSIAHAPAALPSAPAPDSVSVTRRRPYQRAAKPLAKRQP